MSDQNRPTEQATTGEEGTTAPPIAPTFNLVPPPEGNSGKRAGLLLTFFSISFAPKKRLKSFEKRKR